MLKLTLFLLAFSLFLVSGNAFLCGLFDCGPTFLVVDSDLNASQIPIDAIEPSDFNTVQDFIYYASSAGTITPLTGIITDAGSEDVNVSALEGAIRVTDDHVARLQTFSFAGSTGHAIPTDSIRYIGIEYNAGTPQVVLKASDTWDEHTEFALGAVVNEDGNLHIINNPVHIANNPSHLIHRLYETEPLKRADRLGGLIIGETGTRNVTVSSGELYDRVNEFSIGAIDTNNVDQNFDSYTSSGVVSFQNSQWDNANYDNAGSLTALNPNKFANLWFYVESDGDLVNVYGTAEYATAAMAETEGVPSTIPDRLVVHGKLIGRIIFQEGAATANDIQSVFTTTFTATGVTTHSLLATLDWGSAGHTGTALTFAGFDGAGAATEYTESNYLLADGSRELTSDWFTGPFGIDAFDLNATGPDINFSQAKVAGLFLSDNVINSSSSFTFQSTQQFRFEPIPADTDIIMLFVGTTNTGQFDWLEDEDRFKFLNNVLFNIDANIFFRDTELGLNSPSDGELKLFADGQLTVDANALFVGDVNVSGNIYADLNIFMDENQFVNFRDDQNVVKGCFGFDGNIIIMIGSGAGC